MIVDQRIQTRGGTLRTALLLTLPLSLAVVAPAAVGAADEGGYSYARTLEGSTTLVTEDAERQGLELNQALLAGDRVSVAPRSRLEVALADDNLLRVDGDSSLSFRSLAGSPDRQDRATVIDLEHGNIQIVVFRDSLGSDAPRIDTGNATIYLNEPGLYRITADDEWTELTVRQGEAELVAGREGVEVGSGEQIVVDGWRDTDARVRVADAEDSLERWGRTLDREAEYASYDEDLDPSLHYRAASLSRHGRWQSYEGRRVWIPRVAADWRPYREGRWVPTPLGLTWVSYESWGWVPYHYGTWDYLPGYGWAWYPGRTFGPSWVYWYWGNDYAAWVPTGYYVRYYGGRHGGHGGFRWGVYGWAGGRWDYYNDWNFCDTRYIGHRDQRRNTYRGDHYSRDGRHAVPRGILTTDTRDITRDRLRRPGEILDTLAKRRRSGDADLPDVTPFVARRGELPNDVRGAVLVDREARRRGAERALPDDAGVTRAPNAEPRRRPALDTSGEPRDADRRARGRVLDGRDSGENVERRLPAAGRSGSPTAPETERPREGRERVLERRPRPTDPAGDPSGSGSPAESGGEGRARRLEPRAETRRPIPVEQPEAGTPPAEPRRRVERERPAPSGNSGTGEEIEARRRRAEEPKPPAAERPPIRRVIEGARRNYPPTPPPAPSSGGSVEREKPRERSRSVETAERSRRVEPKPETKPPSESDARSAKPREERRQSDPPPQDGERRRRPKPPGE